MTDLAIDLSLLIQLATLISVVVGVFGLMISVRAYRRQVNSQFMLEYTHRVDDLLNTLPPHVLGLTVIRENVSNEAPPPPSDELSMKVLRCLNRRCTSSRGRAFSRRPYGAARASSTLGSSAARSFAASGIRSGALSRWIGPSAAMSTRSNG